MRTIIRRYDPSQPRGTDGRWGDGAPDPTTNFFDLAGLDNVVEIEGTFGDLAMGTDDVGDVRLAFRDSGQVIEMDLDGEDIAGLGDALEELAAARGELPDAADPRGVYDDRRFGFEDSHKAELLGSGVIAVTFGADEDDPATLHLDPPDPGGEDADATDDVADLLGAIDEVLQGGSVNRAGIARRYDPNQRRDNHGKWSRTAWNTGTVNLLSGPVEIGALGDDEVSIASADGEAQFSASIGFRLADLLRGELRSEGSGLAVGRARNVTSYEGDRYAHEYASLTRVGEDQYEIDLATGDGTEPPETVVLLTVSRAELQAVADSVDRKAASRQIETSQGPFTSEPVDGGVSMTLPATAGSPINVAGTSRAAADLSDAIRELIGEIDEFPLDDNGNPLHGPNDAVARRTVQVGNTELLLESYGQYGSGRIEIQSSAHDWHLVLPDTEAESIGEALDAAVSIDESVERARSPENGEKAAPAGGQFAAGGGRVGGKGKKPPARRRGPAKPAAPAGPMSFDGKTGSGYGIKGGDPRVRTLQAALTRLGITDSAGKGLALDGKYGPKTTSAVKKLQKALGLKADGQVTPELLKQITDLKQLPPAAKPRAPRKRSTSTRRSLLIAVNRALRLGVEVRHPQLFDRAFALDDIQILRSGDGRTVEAYAAMFNAPYEVRDQHGHYMEVIDRAAFNRTLSNGAGKTALCLYNHGMSVVDGKTDSLAQVPLGTPVEIKADGRGLLTVTRYNKSALADSVLEAIRNGDIRSQSFRGRIIRSSPDRLPARNRTGGLPTITRHELGLADYGPTPIPVNAGAEIMAVRSLTELVQDFAALDDDGRLELLRTLGIDPDGGRDEEAQDEASTGDDDTTTSAKSELGSEDSPAHAARHSGRLELQRAALRAELILKGVRRG